MRLLFKNCGLIFVGDELLICFDSIVIVGTRPQWGDVVFMVRG